MSYRTRRLIRRFLTVALWLFILGLLFWGCWMIWIQRYVVYTPEGVKIDLTRSTVDISGQIAVPPKERDPVSIHFVAAEDVANVGTELGQILGFHATTDALLHDVAAVSNQIDLLTPDSAVMIDLKSIYGNFFYHTKIPNSAVSENINATMVDNLITKLTSNDYYAIARVPAFREMDFDTTACLLDDDGYPWHDEEYCIWLDPTDDQTMAYLIQICTELQSLGFDEVVFYEFRFPDSSNYNFDSDLTKTEAIERAAADLISACTTGNFAVSFEGDTSFVLPEGRSRLYINGISADKAASTAAAIPVADPAVNLVFMATSNDTRYNEFSALRAMNVGQDAEEVIDE